jgi:hypothetical protein
MPSSLTLITAFLLIRAPIPLFANHPFPSFSLSSLPVPADTDTIYLDRNGKILNRRERKTGAVTVVPPIKTYIVKTTCTTDDLYADSVLQGKSNPISRKEARRTERLIKAGKFNEALATGNLLELLPLELRNADWKHLMKDNGQGDTAAANNREYGIDLYRDGRRVEKIGEIYNPCHSNPDVSVTISRDLVTNTHSHPSGTRSEEANSKCSFDPQAPSSVDINSVPPQSGYWTVFGMASGLVYLYNTTGVLAVLKIKRYIH